MTDAVFSLSESAVKKGVEDYLQFQMNLGRLWYCRLNAGTIVIPNKDGINRLFKGVEKGTADLLAILSNGRAVFIECKSTKGIQSPIQKEFEGMITELNCRYMVVRDVDELIELLWESE